jgi:glycosyltransferase involved in cell wall biosynthesis
MNGSDDNGRHEPVRVMHVITALGTGGAEIMLYRLLAAGGSRWQSMVVCLKDEGTVGPRITELGVPVECLNARLGAPNPTRLLAVLRIARSYRPDIIQGWLVHGNLLAGLAGAVQRRRPAVFWGVHQTVYDLNKERSSTALAIRASALLSGVPRKVIYVSRVGAAQHEALGYPSAKRVVIPNGFDCGMFRPNPGARRRVRAALGVAEDTVVIGLFARYHPMKDHANFLRAAGIVAREVRDVHFLLAGRGVTAEETEIRSLIEDEGIREQVSLLGDRKDTAELAAALDIGCLSSAWGEALSLFVGEAMACGVPCAVTDVGDNGYLVGETGRVVPPGDPQALAGALLQLVEMGAEARSKLGMAARQRIEEEFSLPDVVQRYQGLYEEFLAENRA